MSYRQTRRLPALRLARRRSRCASAPRFADHSRETFDSVLDTCERIAREKYAPFNRIADTEEPWFDGEKVHLPRGQPRGRTRPIVESGMLAAAQDYEIGGMQLPCVVEMAANSFFSKAGIGIGGGGMLTSGNANLLMVHGTPLQQEVFAKNEFSGRFSGTMCLSEPQAGSSLSDIATRAVPDGADFESDPLGPRYRLRGNKMWISNGEHELTENIVHLVLAKIPGDDGKLDSRHARHLALHRAEEAGRRRRRADRRAQRRRARRPEPQARLPRHPQHAAQFRRRQVPGAQRRAPGAIGYLVGRPRRGPALHVPHDERGAHRRRPRRDHARLRRLRGLARLREEPPAGAADRPRRQGPGAAAGAASSSTPTSSACCSRRRATAKARSRSSCTARAWSTSSTPATTRRAHEARLLLEVLTPIAKSWPSEWCLEANSLAIQVHGGYGYTRDFPVEQYWRDNRLNMIHEGTHGIQALDLLGRKVVMDGGAGLDARCARRSTRRSPRAAPVAGAGRARAGAGAARPTTSPRRRARPGRPASRQRRSPTRRRTCRRSATWCWPGSGSTSRPARPPRSPATLRSAAGSPPARYFFRYELPRIGAWLGVVETRDDTCRTMAEEWF